VNGYAATPTINKQKFVNVDLTVDFKGF